MKWSMWVWDTKTASIGRSAGAGVRSIRPRSTSSARPCHRRFTRSAGSPVCPFSRRGLKVDFMGVSILESTLAARQPVWPDRRRAAIRAPVSRGPRALVFDFDGVIADDEPLHLAAFQRTLAAEGVALTAEAYYARYLGFDDHDAIVEALREAGRPLTPERAEALMAAKAGHFLDLVRDGVRIFPGVPEFVRAAAARVPLAIASGALRREIALILAQAGLTRAFAAIVSAEDVEEGKPSPAAFLCALERLRERAPDLAAEHCLVVEDSRAGIEAARRAGMRCLAVTNSYAAEALADADLVVRSLEEVGWERLEALF